MWCERTELTPFLCSHYSGKVQGKDHVKVDKRKQLNCPPPQKKQKTKKKKNSQQILSFPLAPNVTFSCQTDMPDNRIQCSFSRQEMSTSLWDSGRRRRGLHESGWQQQSWRVSVIVRERKKRKERKSRKEMKRKKKTWDVLCELQRQRQKFNVLALPLIKLNEIINSLV